MVSNRLHGKSAVITGGAAGIGRAAALRFAEEGADVVVSDISEDGAGVADDIIRRGGSSAYIYMDVTDERSVAEGFRAAQDAFGSVDILFNCAGGSTNEDAQVHALDLTTIERTLHLDLLSVMLCSRAALPWMIAHHSGAIINMSSFAALRGVLSLHAYSAAKGAVISLTRSMAGSYAGQGIRVNAIAPGFALTERTISRRKADNIASDTRLNRDTYPFGTGTPEDIAAVAAFLASDDSRMINAQTIVADGGMSCY
jgi:NAD(P)-dependent dehydrogenase (short-subunit alcohol dehydrogenase family)